MKAIYRRIIEKYPSYSIIAIYSIVSVFIAILFYMLIPIILNYPPESINTQFDKDVSYIPYYQQYIIIVAFILTINFCFLKLLLRGIDKWKILINEEQKDYSKIEKIRKKCLNLPYLIPVFQVIIPVVAVFIVMAFIIHMPSNAQKYILISKISITIFSFVTFIALISHIFSKRIFTNILSNTFLISQEEGIKINLTKRIIFQLVPIFLTALLFTSLLGYSRLVNQLGIRLYKNYHYQLKSILNEINHIDNANQAKEVLDLIYLENSNDYKFFIGPDGEIFPENKTNPLSEFFVKYMTEISPSHDGHVHDFYGADIQGAVYEIQFEKDKWIFGIRYEIVSNESVMFYFISFTALLLFNLFGLSYISRTLADDISRVASSLNEIAISKDIDLDNKLAVTSNDEVGELVLAFNRILDKEKDNIKSIKEQQSILVEQERLASLGQLIGGIAHNIRTPIMSLSGAIEALKDLAYEYRDSIDDRSVTEQDHKEIAKEMLTWLDKMRPYCAYMSDVISAVKGQAVQMNASTMIKFTIDELIKRVDLLMRHELKKNHIVLSIDSDIDMNTEIKGEISNLIQVFDNLIINAVHAYEGKTGTIELKITRAGDNIEFEFKDNAKGIPKEITDRLFKEMVTTKGKNGTGLGLYMSYSTIKGRFGGNMSFNSVQGKGTTFYITIPCITYDKKEVR